jgi:hypothetical protein
VGYNRVRGKPFRIAELEAEAERVLAGGGQLAQRVEVRAPAPRATATAPAAEPGDGG